VKSLARAGASVAALPALVSYALRARLLGPDRALEGSTQALALLPGLPGQYVRRAFLSHVLAECHYTATIEFGTIFSQTGARIAENAYVGPRCHIGLVHIGRGALLAAGVHVPSGARTHGINVDRPIRDQPIQRTLITIGEGAWIGAAAVILADVGLNTIVGSGAVVTRALPANTMAAGVPARVIKQRAESGEPIAVKEISDSTEY
jgi:acetyltransferase-like isoleucine patch superfamily enzyme